MRIADVTIVVPARNEAENIGPFLESIPSGIPILVVDESDDATPHIVRGLRPRSARVVRVSGGGIARARPRGAELASTPWLLFTDADVEFDAAYFERLARREPADVVYGLKLSRDEYARHYRTFAWGQRLSHVLGIPAATGSNMLVKRETLLACGGFDPALSCNEDSELVWRIRARGGSVRIDPALVVWARDHRRLRRGVLRKTMHSLLRCALLRSGLLPERMRRHDWGYWSDALDP
jgi:glycosyltransferase involved in cell wall biosynthesis